MPNFCTFEIASLPNVLGHYLRKYGTLEKTGAPLIFLVFFSKNKGHWW